MMRTMLVSLGLLLGVAGAPAQETPSSQRGPILNGVGDASVPTSAEPAGGYRMEPGMTAPKIVQPVAAAYPEEATPEGSGRCLLSMIINPDGMPLFIHVVHSAGEALDAAAIYAVRQSKFEAGLRDGKAVPIRTVVRVTFTADRAAASPEILKQTTRGTGDTVAADYPPHAIIRADAEFSEEARRKKINGTVTLSLLVTEEGMPTDVRVVNGLGYGLDEKAVEAAKQYRFRPAMKDGKPVAQHIAITVNFHTY